MLDVTINKKDVDLTVTVYEEQPDGTLFHVGYALKRASFARDATHRVLLQPGKPTLIPYETTVIARQCEPGGRLLVLLDVNMKPAAEVNYGSGRDVSVESVSDTTQAFQIEYHSDSNIVVPIGQ